MNRINGFHDKCGNARVFVDDIELSLEDSLKVVNHSPTGFSWGYPGSGPAQLALAILLQFTDPNTAQRLHHHFKWHFLEGIKDYQFDMDVDVPRWIDEQLNDLNI